MLRLLILALVPLGFLSAADTPFDLRVGEDFVDPIGFHDATPVFSWKLPAAGGVTAQKACRIIAASSAGKLPDAPDLWDSGKIDSPQSAWFPYAGKALGSRQEVYWQVKFWDQDGKESPWSKPARFELGLLTASDWQAEWIQMAVEPPAPEASPKVTIEKALYGELGNPARQVDVTEVLRKQLADGKSVVTAGNNLVGNDPAFGVVKSLSLVITRNGKREELKLAENKSLDLLKPSTPKPSFIPEYLRREFSLAKPIAKARLHVTAKGLYEIHLNGAKVGEDFMAPGCTPYAEKIETLTYDVTSQLRAGQNAVSAILGEGWFAGRFGRSREKQHPQLLLQLDILHPDGSFTRIASDASWKATNKGPIRFSGIWDGENYDARMELPGWNKVGYDDSAWKPVLASKIDPTTPALLPKRFDPVRIVAELPTIKVTEPQPGRFVFDLGQNMVGWPVLRIPVSKDRTVTVRYAEMLEKDGTLYTKNYRSARSTNTYIPAADSTITWHPVFTFHGFRYVELSGLPDGVKPEPGWVTGKVLHSNFGWTGRFASSHKLLNQLQSNITWGLRGNFLDIPTDCPQRDERLGWTGDAQVFAPAAIFNASVHAFFASWLESMRLDQRADGAIPSVVPDVLGDHSGGPGWGDAATIVPWEIYVRTGDINILTENFDMMKRWVGWYESKAKDHIVDVTAFGDWLQPYPKQGGTKGDTPRDLIGTAYFARSADLTARAARRLGNDAEAARLEKLASEIRRAFTAKFFDNSGKLTTPVETQTAYLLALGFDLLPQGLRPQAVDHLVRLVGEADGHLRTGFLGTPLLAPVLDRFGRADLAYAVLFKETYPSWFFSIHQGATTMWERWNSYSHADGFGDAGMNSFNHYAYGAIGQWMYERIAGLAPDPEQPGYRHFFIQPLPGGPLSHASAELETPFGTARSAWKRKDTNLELQVLVPPNTTATLRLPANRNLSIQSGGKPLRFRVADGQALLDLVPGSHDLTISGF